LSESTKDQEHKFEDDTVLALLYVREELTKAFLRITPKIEATSIKPEPLEIAICAWLEGILAIDLIDDRALKDALKYVLTETKPIERRIAKGKLSVPGRDGKLILLVKPFTPVFEGEYKLWDKFQKRFDSITEEQPLARIYPPVLGTAGINVFGKAIEPLAAAEVNLNIDSSLKLIPASKHSYQEVISAKNGYLVSTTDSKKHCTLKVESIYEIPSDVDHSTGSLDFIGGATIKGSIMKGFQVICKDEIIVKGEVFDAKIESKTASVIIHGNILGSEEQRTDVNNLQYDDFKWIKARLDVQAKALESQAIFAGRSITINSNALRCIVSSGSQIVVNGAFYAAKARTVCGIEVGNLGNASGVNTEIEFLPLEEAGEDFLELEAKIARLKNRQESLSLFLGPYVSNPKELAKLSSIHKEKIKSSVQLLENTKSKITTLEQERENLGKNTKKNLISRLNVIKEVFPGVTVYRKDQKYTFDERKKGPFTLAYIWDENRFEIRSLEKIDCEWSEQEPTQQTTKEKK